MSSIFLRFYHRKYHGIYRHAKKLFIFDLALLGLAVIMLGVGLFFFFWKPAIVGQIDLAISIGDGRIKSGENARLTIDYGNRSKFKLNEVKIGVRLPAGFIIDRAKTPEDIFSKDSIFNLNEVEPGAKGQVNIYGRLWTAPQTEEKILAFLSYLPESANEREQRPASLMLKLPESVLRGELIVAASSFPRADLPFNYILRNTADEPIEGIDVSHNWPVKIFNEKNLKNITLKGREEKIIQGELLIPNRAGQIPFQFTSQLHINDHPLVQTINSANINIFTPKFTLAGEFPADLKYIEPGQTIPLRIVYKNNSDSTYKNLKIRVGFTAGVVDVGATARENQLKTDGGELVIDGKKRTALSAAEPGHGDSFSIDLKLLRNFLLGNLEKVRLETTPYLEIEAPEVPGQKSRLSGAVAGLPIATELSLRAETRYYTDEGDQLGRGPLPPSVGETTKYWIFVKINNTSNKLSGASFRTILPAGVELSGRQSVTIGPSIKYDSIARAVSWSYDELPANSQTGLYFEVAMTPTPEQVGKVLSLTGDLYFSAKDDWTGKLFNLKNSGLNNILPTDDRGMVKGANVMN